MIDVDISDVLDHGREAAALHRKFPDRLLRTLESFADEARGRHAYQNRTGDLEASTQVVQVGEGADEVTYDLTMGEEYASYVIDRGFSDFPEIEARAEQAVAAEVGDVMAKASR